MDGSFREKRFHHYSSIIMDAIAPQITGVSMVCSTICSGADRRKHQSSASLAVVRVLRWWPMNSPHKGPVTRKMFPFDDAITWPGNAHTTENKRSIWHQFDNFVVTGGRGGCAVMTTYGATSDTKVKSCQIDLFVFSVRQWWIQSTLVTKPCYNTPYRQITQSLEVAR